MEASIGLLYLSAFASLFDAIKHGAQLGQPLPVHCGHTLHVLLQTKSTGLKTHTKAASDHPVKQQQALHLGCHDKLVVDDVVRRVAHPKERAGGMEVTRHACPHVHIFTDALGANSRHKQQIKYAAHNLQM